ncbi:hypothetical protein HZH68_011671 [Vespula germanica]|uniref:Uncharacterized protein n=1 Tax=Vespula germanica TaxID=30212 RepID=A0A834JKD5_VESGE|nr:hypothetical protein HZH68_011671 [Vespula germanica]
MQSNEKKILIIVLTSYGQYYDYNDDDNGDDDDDGGDGDGNGDLPNSFDPDGIKPTTFTWFPSSNGTSMFSSRQTKSILITEGQFRTEQQQQQQQQQQQ